MKNTSKEAKASELISFRQIVKVPADLRLNIAMIEPGMAEFTFGNADMVYAAWLGLKPTKHHLDSQNSFKTVSTKHCWISKFMLLGICNHPG